MEEETGFGFDDFSIEMQEFEVKKTSKFDRMVKIGAGGSITQTPLIHNGRIYFGSCDQNVYCLDALTGKEIWRFRTKEKITVSSPKILDDIIYVGSNDQNMYAINANTGKLIWKFRTYGIIYSVPFIYKGVVYFGSQDNNMYAVDAKTGKLIWKFRTQEWIMYSPTVYDGRVFFGSFDYNFYCLDAGTGKLIWKFKTQGEIWETSPPLIDNNIIYFTSFDNFLYALGIDDGKMKWRFKTGTYGNCRGPVLYKNVLYQGTREGVLHALTLKGKPLWKFVKNKEILEAIYPYNDKIYVGSGDYNLYCLDIDGKELWRFHTQGRIYGSLVIWNDIIYFGNWDCHLYALDLNKQKPVWTFRTNGSPCYIPPPYESFEVQLKIPETQIGEGKKKTYELDLKEEEEEREGAYKSRITYQVSTQYVEKGKYQVDSDEEAL
jgi:outer membrane protein assembly factor BamB